MRIDRQRRADMSVRQKSISLSKVFRERYGIDKSQGMEVLLEMGLKWVVFGGENAAMPSGDERLAYTINDVELARALGAGVYRLTKIGGRFKVEVFEDGLAELPQGLVKVENDAASLKLTKDFLADYKRRKFLKDKVYSVRFHVKGAVNISLDFYTQFVFKTGHKVGFRMDVDTKELRLVLGPDEDFELRAYARPQTVAQFTSLNFTTFVFDTLGVKDKKSIKGSLVFENQMCFLVKIKADEED
jgi:hypothetical protein